MCTQCLPSSVEDRLADALVVCFTDVFNGLVDLKKAALRVNAAATSPTADNPGSPAGQVLLYMHR